MVVHGDREHALGAVLADDVVVEHLADSAGVGTPSVDFTIEVLFSSRMMSMHSSTHSSQMNTVGPAISLRTSCCDFPQNEQYSVFLEDSPLVVSLDILSLLGAAGSQNPR